MSDATNPRIKERACKKMLRCDLTEEERRDLADNIAEKQAELTLTLPMDEGEAYDRAI